MRLWRLIRRVGAALRARVLGLWLAAWRGLRWLRAVTSYGFPLIALAVGDIASDIWSGLSGIQGLGLAISAAAFAVGTILALLYFMSRGLRERGKELIEAAIILCIIIALGPLILQFAASIGQRMGGPGVGKIENPWK